MNPWGVCVPWLTAGFRNTLPRARPKAIQQGTDGWNHTDHKDQLGLGQIGLLRIGERSDTAN
eukprot:464974-Prymnesium_polylepis.1